VIKTSSSQEECKMLNMLEDLFYKRKEKPHMSLLAQIHHNDKVTIIIQRGPIDLFDYITRKTEHIPSPPEKIPILRSIIKKLSMLHQRKIAHLDISAENVLYENQEAFLIDFESSQFLDPESIYHFNMDPSNTHGSFGKIVYMTREQISGNPFNGFQEDIFALGILTFFLFFQNFPFSDHKSEYYDLLHSGKIATLLVKLGLSGHVGVNPCVLLAMDFISKCCGPDTKRPCSAGLLLQDPLFYDM
jgi:serine/threonine protein kinase